MSFEEAATIPIGLDTAALALYSRDEVAISQFSVGLYPPWEEGGRGKYSGKPIVVLGGASSVGQSGMPPHTRMSKRHANIRL